MPGSGAGSRWVAGVVQRFRLVAFVCGWDRPWRPGAGPGAASLT